MGGLSVSKLLFALLLIGIGVAFLLSNFGVIAVDVGDLFATYWPVILIWIGLSTIISSLRHIRSWWGGTVPGIIVGSIIALLGWNFLADNLGWNTISFSLLWNVFWPIVLIYIGFRILFRKPGNRHFRIDIDFDKKPKWEDTSSDLHHEESTEYGEGTGEPKKTKRISKSSLIGDINMGREMFHLEDLQLWNGIGDVDLDLTRAIIPEGESKILISGWIGDVDVIVPKDLPIWVEVQIRAGEIQLFGKNEGGLSREQTFKSVGYDEAEKKVRMIIDLKIGDIRVVER